MTVTKRKSLLQVIQVGMDTMMIATGTFKHLLVDVFNWNLKHSPWKAIMHVRMTGYKLMMGEVQVPAALFKQVPTSYAAIVFRVTLFLVAITFT